MGEECWLDLSDESSELVSRSVLRLSIGISKSVLEDIPSWSGPRSALESESEEAESIVRLDSEIDPEVVEELSESVSTWWLTLMACWRAVRRCFQRS